MKRKLLSLRRRVKRNMMIYKELKTDKNWN